MSTKESSQQGSRGSGEGISLDLSNMVDNTLEFVSLTSRSIIGAVSQLNFLDNDDNKNTNTTNNNNNNNNNSKNKNNTTPTSKPSQPQTPTNAQHLNISTAGLGVASPRNGSPRVGSARAHSPSCHSSRTHVKCVLVGDTDTKPDRLRYITAYTEGKLTPRDSIGRIGSLTESFSAQASIEGMVVAAAFWIAPDSNSIRPLVYTGADVIIVLYNSSQPKALESIEKVWIPELLMHVPTVPWLLASTNHNESRDLHLKASAVAERVGMCNFAKTSDSVDSVRAMFEAAFRLVILESESITESILTQRRDALQMQIFSQGSNGSLRMNSISELGGDDDDDDVLETTTSKNGVLMQEALKKLEKKIRHRSSSIASDGRSQSSSNIPTEHEPEMDTLPEIGRRISKLFGIN